MKIKKFLYTVASIINENNDFQAMNVYNLEVQFEKLIFQNAMFVIFLYYTSTFDFLRLRLTNTEYTSR